MRYQMQDVGSPSRKLSGSTPKACLERSRGVMASLLRPGDRVSGSEIAEVLTDEDGEITLLFMDESHHTVE